MTEVKQNATKRPRKMARAPKEAAVKTIAAPASPTNAKPLAKCAMVERLLAADGGATLAQLCEATGWLPHTSRAFLTGLRKKGRAVERSVGADGKSIYRIAALKAAA